jgi:hypothetical protein
LTSWSWLYRCSVSCEMELLSYIISNIPLMYTQNNLITLMLNTYYSMLGRKWFNVFGKARLQVKEIKQYQKKWLNHVQRDTYCITFRNLASYMLGRAQRYPPKPPFYIFFQQIYVQNFLNMLHTLRFFPLQNAFYFIMLPFLVPALFAFYIQGVLKFKCQMPVPKRLIPKQALQYTPKGWRIIGRPRKWLRDHLHLED